MTVKVQALLDTLPAQGCIEDLGLLVDAIRGVFDLKHVAYHAFSLGRTYTVRSASGAGALACSGGVWRRENESVATFSYGAEWGRRYEEAEFWRIDPVVEAAVQSFVPVDWKAADWSMRKRRDFLREAVDSGVGRQGYTIPIRGPDGQFAVFTVNKDATDDEWDRYLSEYRGDFLIVSHFFHQKVLEIERVFGPPATPQLSAREKDALTYLSAGKSRAQVAHVMQISENTLRVYLDSARHKLGALNITHAVAIGVQRGILNI
jgi:DNA-binding CsgD family transcriptional regulator